MTTETQAHDNDGAQARAGRAITIEEYRELLATMPSIRTSSEAASVLTADDYFKVVRKQDTRPAFWKFQDVRETLDRLAEEPLREAERRFCTTVNADTGELVGASPFIFIGWQLIHPGEEVPPHRHNSVAIYHILEGSGYTAVQSTGQTWAKYHWEKGDTLACPAWAYHAHYAEGEQDTLMYVVQDMPMMAASRTLFWEEPLGQENIRHMVVGTSPSWSVTRHDGAGQEG
ncbi:cupin domain-containing protein [[Actinomadura] parvosata]|uniref:cupin domain-containing protein n=1 Tax=[Actinomadura] parvosata TaxID=1955412 RepID=UPI00406C0C80